MGGLHNDIARALALLPAAQGVMTAKFEQARAGVLIRWVMQCASQPVFICVALLKGSRLAPIIRDSRSFALCLIDCRSRLLLKKFDDDAPEDDPFDSFSVGGLRTGSPILTCAIAAIDCEVARHFDLEADHELYVGQVMDARIFDQHEAAHQ